MIEWLQKWYELQCDGNWEHYYGVKIETLDNPEWSVKIDLNGADVNIEDIEWELFETSSNDWYDYKVINNIFSAGGDPMKLKFLLTIFKDLLNK